MGTRFVLGQAGSGKTHYLYEVLVDHISQDPLNRHALVIVPKQSTFITEQALACDPRLRGLINIRVTAPDQIGEMALIETGASAGARLDSIGRKLIITYLLQTHIDHLQHYGKSAIQPGLAEKIDQAFLEFEYAGRPLESIQDLIDRFLQNQHSASQTLARKLTDLKLLYQLYRQFLERYNFDSYHRQMQALDAIRNWPFIQNALILVDDFYDLTVYERQILTAVVSTAPRSLISMLVSPHSPLIQNIHHLPEETRLLFKSEHTYRKLHFALTQSGVRLETPTILTESPRFRSPVLKSLQQGLQDRHLPPIKQDPDNPSVQRIETDTPAAEVDAAACYVLDLLRQGYRLRDICILARSIEEYEPFIESSFAEHGLAFFTDKRRPAVHHPLVRSLIALGQIIQTRWSHEGIIELLRTGLTKIRPHEVDLLEDYIRQHHIPPSQWSDSHPWTFSRPVPDDEETVLTPSLFTEWELEKVKEIQTYVRQNLNTLFLSRWVNEKATVRDRITDLIDILKNLEVEKQFQRLILQAEQNKDIQLQEVHLQVWTNVRETLDQIVQILGDVEVSAERFSVLLQQTLSKLDLAITPPTIDQVLVGSVDRTRVTNPKVVILLGMNAGQFPKLIPEQPLLNDRDRQQLSESGVEIGVSSRQALLEEQFLGYLALTRGREKLLLLRTVVDASGNSLEASPFWKWLDQRIESVPTKRLGSRFEQIANPRQAISFLLDWARHSQTHTPTNDVKALYQWVVQTDVESVRKNRDRAWPSLRYSNEAVVCPENALRLFGKRLESSVSQFESFAACPFQHFARYGLRLQTPPESELTALDLGILYHSVLEKLVKRIAEQYLDFTTAPVSSDQIHQIAQEVGTQLRNQIFLTNAQNRYTLDRIQHVVYRLMQAQQFVLSKGSFRPAFVELVFGRRGQWPALELKTPNGNEVLLSGKIDRIDIDEQHSRYAVIDYKLSGKSLSMTEVWHGLCLQLLTYLLVIEANRSSLANGNLLPAGAMYLQIRRPPESVKDPEKAPSPHDPQFHTKIKPRGLLNGDAINYLDPDLGPGQRSELFQIHLKNDGAFAEKGCDAVPVQQFEQIIDFVRDKIVELADQIISGYIKVEPYLINSESPCSRCDFARVCRFDRLTNRYKVLSDLSHREALNQITQTRVTRE
ncbi:MAG: ATP-dependent helicase/deoxyribonuclease subunit B [Phycisphaerae bacterium]|jgi:ATP-dependent helicase/nuclease subunit B|nr:MAG: ATP-dependent helicase/deoxyribonuclease subunit B [Phycisphaerae bacterium]